MDYLTFDTVVVGSGAAGYNAASEIKKLCNKGVCIVTEGINTGTSRNTGSDKQTYYKLSLSGSTPDSVRMMAEDLFSFGAVDGDNALCEAALSVRCFNNLCSLGVPFPVNRYGEYVGYKTDHDKYMRATSAGPLTSKFMTQALQQQAEKLSVPVFDNLLAVEIIKSENKVSGLLCYDKENKKYKAFRCNNIVLATGGPAGIYKNTVYPDGHTGSTGLAVKAGAVLQNMTEWQYGLSSVKPRWNVSGTYMQVLPRFVSTDENGREYEFLTDYFPDIYKALSLVFLKGYQWPFDSAKANNGSSQIDLAVYNECINKKRRVFLDYTKNPFSLDEIDYTKLSHEAYTYLKNADARFGKPVERLKKMNTPAYELYFSKGVDISKEYLEINLCAQHNNGGIAVDMWWQTNIDGLFAAGECAGTHGIARPGGSALNAGQTGSLRAAQYISEKEECFTSEEKFSEILEETAEKHNKLISELWCHENNVNEYISIQREKMSSYASAVRNIKKIDELIPYTSRRIKELKNEIRLCSPENIPDLYKYIDALWVQSALLRCIKDYWDKVGCTRGSAVYTEDEAVSSDTLKDMIQEIYLENGEFFISWRKCRPIPPDDGVFENVWRSYRENKNIY